MDSIAKPGFREPPEKKYYPALDGLRGIAIILVILYHYFSFVEYFNYGWLGVDLFFVLSGFLITNILLNSLNTGNYYRNFYARRILRIFPLYYLSLLLFLIILPSFEWFTLDMSFYQENQKWFWTYLQNWTLIFKDASNSNALDHFWSLAIEEQFYILWPLVIMLVRKPKYLLILCFLLLAAVITARVIIWNYHNVVPSYQRLFLFTRIDGILAGSMLASVYFIRPTLPGRYLTAFIVSLTVLNYFFYFITRGQSPDFPSWGIAGFTTFSFLFALIVYVAVLKENKVVNYFLMNPVLRLFGKYSYAFYIFHWPLYLLLFPMVNRYFQGYSQISTTLQLTFTGLILVIVSLIVSIFSYYTFEKHFLKLKRYF